ncbi:MAG: hypothetical protein K9I26_02215 [Flavobacterium sp.]|nr:hypothetical protein [Flavobacterium sp.]
MKHFKLAKNLILASHISGVYDVNRSSVLPNDDFSIVAAWAKSIADLGLQGILFHNNFSEATCKEYENDFLHFIKVEYNNQFNPNVFRYFVYNEFLKKHAESIDNLFFTDVSDVVVLKNPFTETLFLDNEKALFCGDELELLNNDWMQEHSTHFRNLITDYANFETDFKYETLLNCGVIGGSITVMQSFIAKLWAIHKRYNSENKTLFTGDMGAFNYLVRTQYNKQLIHGNPVNTVFKKYENSDSCWFKHK